MLEAEIKFVLNEDFYYRRLVNEVARSFSLVMRTDHLRPVRTIDRYFDTEDLLLLKKEASLRIRERRFITKTQSEGRLTLKTPDERTKNLKLAVVRHERKLNLEGWHWDLIRDFFSEIGMVLVGGPMVPIITVEALSEEIQLGEGDQHMHLSLDNLTYVDEASFTHKRETILEIESHGYPVNVLEDIGEFCLEKYQLESTKESTYLRGVKKVGIYPAG
jgi:inorganic triphosphatase YgiF